MNKNEFQAHLENDIIPFWNKMKDGENGGFYGYADSNGVPDKNSVKGVILHSRILWFYSSAYLLLHQSGLLEMAEHAYRFLIEHCFDSRYGGVYWSVNSDGSVADDSKHTYCQAFALYALSAYYRACRKTEALQSAYSLYHIIEENCKDGGGYLEAFHRDFSPASNEKLSENGVLAGRTMNTLLHVMEAYTELYRADGLKEAGDSLRYILQLFEQKVYNKEKKICDVFFDKEYHSLIEMESYGHDIEASWLIDRCCEVLGDNVYSAKMQPLIDGLAAGALVHGMDTAVGALNNECENKTIDRQKIWWVQAEAVTGFYNAYLRDRSKSEYLEAAQSVWEFIRSTVIDKNSGEWFESILENKTAALNQPLVHLWKCPYHNGRMCMEMIQRLSQTTRKGDSYADAR